jgi:hypothetical protein
MCAELSVTSRRRTRLQLTRRMTSQLDTNLQHFTCTCLNNMKQYETAASLLP